NFSIYDSEDQLSAIKNVMNRIGVSPQMYPPAQIRSVISSSKNKMIDAKELMRDAKSTFNKQAALVFENYDSYMRENNAMDFDDLIINMIYLFGKSPETLQKYQEKFKYMMVDEYQDTNR